ncbi:MAG TPA: hypothetical protein PKC69_01315 [Chitinophagaceae bacterium]|nr:hypothetical protein [Chitinophagaceae bacterium]
MANKNYIQVLTGWAMLLFFTLSITPKQYLHDLFAGHQDMAATAQSKDTQVAKQGYHCECNSLVATSPFTEQDDIPFIQPLVVYQPAAATHLTESFHSAFSRFYELRGPPAII